MEQLVDDVVSVWARVRVSLYLCVCIVYLGSVLMELLIHIVGVFLCIILYRLV